MRHEPSGETAQSVSPQIPPLTSPRTPDVRIGRRPLFFVGMAAILLAIVAVGFAPTFYLRTYFDARRPDATSQAYPLYLYVHGVVLTLWFLLFFGQTLLIALRRKPLHRSVGVAGAVLAAAVFSASLLVVIRSIARSGANGVSAEQLPLVVIGDIGALLLFALFVTGGIWFRQTPDVHKRLMLLASITIIAPAISRLPGGLAFFPFSVIVPQLALYGALVVYDVTSARRIHRVTVWGLSLYVAIAVATVVAGTSELGRALVNALK